MATNLPVVPDDSHYDNILAAGAILMVLWLGQPKSLTSIQTVVTEDGVATNQIDVTFSFMMSAYRLTVERIPD